MSALIRFTSASLAGWVRIIVSSLIQIILVPVYLAYWNNETYGIWLVYQTLVGFSRIIDTGYQNFLGYEFLQMGSNGRKSIAKLFSSSLPVGIMIGFFDLIMLLGVLFVAQHWPSQLWHPIILDSNTFDEVAIALIAQSLAWLLCGTVGGIAVRVVAPFGYYPRMAWWGVASTIITGIIPVIAVVCGADILGAGIAYAASVVIYAIPFFWDFWRVMRRANLFLMKPDIFWGLNAFLRSQVLTLKSLLEMLRQQGARLILAPLAGVGELAAFSTMRTGANTALQGLGTITNPVMPELMRFLNERDQARMEAAFGTVWIVVIAGMSPFILVLQAIMPPLFRVWTHGKIQFDPALFALLSLGVLVYAAAQPAMTVAQGNNLLRPQLILSAMAGGIVVGGMFVLVPRIGILGAGWALLIGEIAGAVGYVKVAAAWLNKNRLHWPAKQFCRVILSVFTAGIAMLGIAWFPELYLIFLIAGLIMLAVIFRSYWQHLPDLAKQRMVTLITKLPGGRRLCAAFLLGRT